MTAHTASTPNVDWGAPLATEDGFWTPILLGLNIVCEMIISPAGVSEVGGFDGDAFKTLGIVGGLGRQGGEIQTFTRGACTVGSTGSTSRQR
jgi:hypothetical protein